MCVVIIIIVVVVVVEAAATATAAAVVTAVLYSTYTVTIIIYTVLYYRFDFLRFHTVRGRRLAKPYKSCARKHRDQPIGLVLRPQ